MNTTVYLVRAKPDEGWWAISVPDLPGVHTQAATVEEIEPMVRDAIALYLSVTTGNEVAEHDFGIEITLTPADTVRNDT